MLHQYKSRYTRNFFFTLIFFLSYSLGNIKAQTATEIILANTKFDNEFNSSDIIITDDYTSKGIRHIYAKRSIVGLPLYNSYAAVHMVDGLVIRTQTELNPFITYNNITNKINLSASDAIDRIASATGKDIQDLSEVEDQIQTAKSKIFVSTSLAYGNIIANQKLYKLTKGDLRYVWSIEIDEIASGKWMNYFVDTQSGEILHEESWTVNCDIRQNHHSSEKCKNHTDDHHIVSNINYSSMTSDSSYNVFAMPLESPGHGVRTLQEKPWQNNEIASPNGWHTIGNINYTTTKGNNSDAYLDLDNTNYPTGGDADRADGGVDLTFDFAWDETSPPADLPLPAITNLFYWTNIAHDVWYSYGFDEASGNFQEENTDGMGGYASDFVRSEAQDGQGSCNANMSTPPDGSNPRIQMFLCNSRDGSLDNGVIIHEYGHGISNRLTGGPAAAGCLGNEEQMGEGWSDWFALMMTIEEDDMATDSRPIGTYLVNQLPTGAGIRPYPYTTDMNVNPMTYASSFSGVSVPHGVGSVWCTMLWDMTWMLIDEHGFDPDFYNGTGGNNMAMELVVEALKLQPCSPGFVDGRDAIIAADEVINGGVNVCKIWEVFSNRGLGYSASQGTSNSREDGTEAYDMPPVCSLQLTKTSNTNTVSAGDEITYTITATNNFTADQTNLVVSDVLPDFTSYVSASNGGVINNGTVSWPAIDIDINEVIEYSLKVVVDTDIDAVVDDVFDDMESGAINWSSQNYGSTGWAIQSDEVYSGSNAWKAVDGSSSGTAILEYTFDLGIGDGSSLLFTHLYDTEASWDGGLVEISIDNGNTWIDLKDDFVTNGYNSTIFNSKPGFSGNSGGYITSQVDLSAYEGHLAKIRFLMNCDQYVGGNGWYIDDVLIQQLDRYIPNIANADTDQFTTTGLLASPTKVMVGATDFIADGSYTNVSCYGSDDGTATILATGGSGLYTYLWSTGETTSELSSLSTGSYYCDVTDGIMTRRKYFFISQPSAIERIIEVLPAIAGTGGSITVDVSGGSAGYTYQWSNNATASAITDLAAGTYMVTVTDSDMCMTIDTIVVNDLVYECNETPFIIEVQFDQSAQELSFEILDEMDNVILEKSFTQSASGTLYKSVVCLESGCYTLSINDSFNDGLCASYSNPMGYFKFTDYYSGDVLVDECDFDEYEIDFCIGPLEATINSVYPSCVGVADGSITVDATGGENEYTYNWSNGATTPTIENITAGNYIVTVSDGITDVILSEQLINGNSRVLIDQNDGIGSLRDVLNNGCPTDTITFSPTLIGDTIYLTEEIVINKSVSIEGMTIYGTYISGSDITRVFHVTDGNVLSLYNLRVLDGNASVNGGAIYNQGELILEAIALDNNTENNLPRAVSGDGAIIIKGTVRIE